MLCSGGSAWLRRRRRRLGRGAAEAARVLSAVPSAGCGVRCIPQKRLAINRHVRAGAAQLLTAGWPPGGSDACLSIGQCFLHWVRVFGCGWVLGGRAGWGVAKSATMRSLGVGPAWRQACRCCGGPVSTRHGKGGSERLDGARGVMRGAGRAAWREWWEAGWAANE